MLYLLKVNNEKKRGLFSRLFSSSVTITEHTLCGIVYCEIEICTGGEPEWNRILKIVGKNKRIIPQTDIKIPDGVPLCTYSEQAAVGQMLADAAVKVIESAASVNPYLSVMLIDREGKYTRLLTPLMKCAQTVTAVTAGARQYETGARCLLDGMGAHPIITDSAASADCNIIIAPDGISGCGTLPLPSMIFAPTGCDCITVEEENINLGDLSHLEGYGKLQLAAALMEEKEWNGAAPFAESMMFRGKSVSLEELANLL